MVLELKRKRVEWDGKAFKKHGQQWVSSSKNIVIVRIQPLLHLFLTMSSNHWNKLNTLPMKVPQKFRKFIVPAKRI